MNSYRKLSDTISYFDLSKYSEIRLIAASNNRVYLYETTDPDFPQQIAVKEIANTTESRECIEQKLALNFKMQNTKHGNIVQIYGIVKEESIRLSGKQVVVYYVCMEYIPHNLQDLIESIKAEQTSINQTLMQFIMSSMIQVNEYLQKLQICHGDLKPQNILIDDILQPTICKLCDFDNMQLIPKKVNQQCIISTQQYHSPEINNAISNGIDMFAYDPFKSQVYSLGLCFIQLHPKLSLRSPMIKIDELAQQLFGFTIAQILLGMLIQDNRSRPDFIELARQLACIDNNYYPLNTQPQQYQNSLFRSQFSLVKSPYQNQISSNTPDMYDALYRDHNRQSKYNNILDSVRTDSSEIQNQPLSSSNLAGQQHNRQLSSTHLNSLLQDNPPDNQNRRCGCECQYQTKLLISGVVILSICVGLIVFLFLHLL